MYEKLEAKIEKIAEGYADLVDARIRVATNVGLCEADMMKELNEEIRILHHAIAALERIARLNKEDTAVFCNEN